MSDKKLDDLEKNIDELISLSQKLKEINLDLIKRNENLRKEVASLNKILDSTEVRLKNLIEENK